MHDCSISKNAIGILNNKIPMLFLSLQTLGAPNRLKRMQLTKCLSWECPNVPVNELEARINQYYEIPFRKRTELVFRRVFNVDYYPWLYNEFFLCFRNSEISESNILKTAQSLQFFITNYLSTPNEISEFKLLHLLVYQIVHPRWDEPDSKIDFVDLLTKWKDLCFKRWGNKYDNFFKAITNEFLPYTQDSNNFSKESSYQVLQSPSVSLTQTEVIWINEILSKTAKLRKLPTYPLSTGPKNRYLRTLDKLVRDWNTEIHRSDVNLDKLEESMLRRVLVSVAVKLMKTAHSG